MQIKLNNSFDVDTKLCAIAIPHSHDVNRHVLSSDFETKSNFEDIKPEIPVSSQSAKRLKGIGKKDDRWKVGQLEGLTDKDLRVKFSKPNQSFAETVKHAKEMVPTDERLRIYYHQGPKDMTTGIVFKCHTEDVDVVDDHVFRINLINFDKPYGLYSSKQVTLDANLEDTKKGAIFKELGNAKTYWKRFGHPRWALLKEVEVEEGKTYGMK